MAIQATFGIPDTDRTGIAILAASLYLAESTAPSARETLEQKCKRVIDASEILWLIVKDTPDPAEARARLKHITDTN